MASLLSQGIIGPDYDLGHENWSKRQSVTECAHLGTVRIPPRTCTAGTLLIPPLQQEPHTRYWSLIPVTGASYPLLALSP